MELESEANPAAEAIEVSDKDAETLVKGAEEAQPDEDTPPEPQDDQDELDKLVNPEPDEGDPDELAEVEFEGKQYKLPAELKDALLRQSDYTKKTMTVAEERKAVAAEREALDNLRSLSNERMEAIQNKRLIETRIKAIEDTPVHGLTQEQITQARLDLQDLKAQLTHWDNYGQQAAHAEQQTREQHIARAREEALLKATKEIPNFNDARRSQLAEYIAASGGDPDMVNSIVDPVVWKVLNDADIGRRFTERQRKAAKIKAAQATQPAQEVGGKSTSRVTTGEMTPAQMAKHLGLNN